MPGVKQAINPFGKAEFKTRACTSIYAAFMPGTLRLLYAVRIATIDWCNVVHNYSMIIDDISL